MDSQPQLQLLPPTRHSDFTEQEQAQLVDILHMPLMRKYLNHLLWDNLTRTANVDLDLLVEEDRKHLLRLAFTKGAIGVLYTLLTISKS